MTKQKYSAASLCSITTEVLKVLNATEELIGEAGGESYTPSDSVSASPISGCSDTRRLDQKLTKMEENVRTFQPLHHSGVVGAERLTLLVCPGVPDSRRRVWAGGDARGPGGVRSQHQQRDH